MWHLNRQECASDGVIIDAHSGTSLCFYGGRTLPSPIFGGELCFRGLFPFVSQLIQSRETCPYDATQS